MKKIDQLKWKLTAHRGIFGYDDSNLATVKAINSLAQKLNEVISSLNDREELSESEEVYILKTNDRFKANLINKSSNMASLLFEIKANMWRDWKHDESSLTLESLKEKINELFDDHNITEEDIGL